MANKKYNTAGIAPGGLFSQGDDTIQTSTSSAVNAGLAGQYAKSAQGWAVGTDTEALDSWTDTDNAKYWAEQAQETFNNVDSELNRIDTDIAEANDLLDRVQNDIADFDSDLLAAEGFADLSQAWAVGPNPAADLGTPTDTNNAHYWATHVAGGHSDAAEAWAAVAQSWATGDTDLDGLDDKGNDTDNAKYWSEQAQSYVDTVIDARDNAQAAEAAAQGHAQSAAGSQALAANDAADAANSATNAAASATAAANSATAAQTAQGAAQDAQAEAETDAMSAADSAGTATTAAVESQNHATASENAAALSEAWARGPNPPDGLVPTDTDNAYYWSTQARDNATKVIPASLADSDEFYYQPVEDDQDTQGVTMAVGIRRRWNSDTNEVETHFRSLDKAHRITAGGEHDTYHGRNEQGHDVEARHSWNMHVESDVAQDIFLFSEEHGGFSHLKPTDPAVQVDLDSEGTHTNLTIYNLSTQLINNEVIDTDTIATRTWVTEHTGAITTDTANIFDTDVFRFGRPTGSTSTILELNNFTTGYNPGTPISTAVYTFYMTQNGIATVVSEVLGSNISVTEADGISRGYWSWPQADEVILHGNYPSPPLNILTDSEHVFVRVREATGEDQNGYVGHVGYGLDTDGGTLTVDTDTIADSEWVIEYVATHGGGGSDSTNLTVAPAQTNVVQGSGDTDITFTVSVSNGTLVAGSTSATATDQHSHGVTPTKVNDTEFTLTVDRSIVGTATIVVTGQINDGTNNHQHTNRARVTVAAAQVDWYIGRGTSAPTDAEPAGYTNAGPKVNGDLITSPSGSDTLYIIAPASDTEFAFRDEFLTIDTTKTANFVTDRDLYTFNEHVDPDIPLTIVGG